MNQEKASSDCVVALFDGFGDESVFTDSYKQSIVSLRDICRGEGVAALSLHLEGKITAVSICLHMEAIGITALQATFIRYIDLMRLALYVQGYVFSCSSSGLGLTVAVVSTEAARTPHGGKWSKIRGGRLKPL